MYLLVSQMSKVEVMRDLEQEQRLEFFSRFVSKNAYGLELGPSYRPTFSKSEGWNVKTLDHCDTPELKDKYLADPHTPNELVERIEAVDFVWQGQPYLDIPGMDGDFDYVVACHVIEHQFDLIQFLNDIASVIKDQGLLLLAVPQRSLMFDSARPLSTLGDVVIAHKDKSLYDLKVYLDETSLRVNRNEIGCWIGDYRNNPDSDLTFNFTGKETNKLFQQLVGNYEPPSEYRDGHRWVFEPETLEYLISQLRAAGLTNLKVKERGHGFGCEFFLVLEKEQNNKIIIPDSELNPDGYLPSSVPAVVYFKEEYESTKNKLNEALSSISRLNEEINGIYNSRSWKLTKPLRRLLQLFRKLKH